MPRDSQESGAFLFLGTRVLAVCPFPPRLASGMIQSHTLAGAVRNRLKRSAFSEMIVWRATLGWKFSRGAFACLRALVLAGAVSLHS